jgi:phage shock protein PspC (stress-responsive transcriptional regulator)
MSEQIHTLDDGAVKRLERSRSNRVVAGVCGGLARYFEIHPAFYRVGFVVLTLLGGAGVLIYLAAVLVIPDEGNEDSIATAALKNRRDRPWPLIGLGLVSVAIASLLSRATLWPHGGALVLLLVAGVAILWLTRHGSAADDSRRIRRVFKWLAIAAASFVALVLIVAGIFAAVFHVHPGSGVGDRTYDVAGLRDLRSDYKLGIGDLTVDLGNVRFPAGETHVATRVDVGSLRVVVPNDVALRVHGDAQLGRVEVLGQSADGRDVDKRIDQVGGHVLVLDAHVGVGNLRVSRIAVP